MLHIRRLSAELTWICFGQLMVIAGTVFGVRLLTYKLSPSIYGDLAIGMTAVIVAQQIFFGPLGNSFLRFFSYAHEKGELYAYVKAVRFLLAKATLLIAVITAISIIGLFLSMHTEWVWLFFLAFVYSLFLGYNIVLDYIQNAARQRKIVALHQGLGQWVHFLIPVSLIGVFGQRSSIVMFGYIVAAVIVLSSQLRFFKKKITVLFAETVEKVPTGVVNKYVKQIFVYAWPFSLWGLFVWAQFASSRWALAFFATTKEVGLYAVLYQFGYYPIIVISGVISQLLVPVLFSRAGSGNDSIRVANTIKLNNFLILVAGVATIIFVVLACIFHKDFFSLVVAPEYRSMSSFLPLLVLSGGLLAVGQMINIIFLIRTETKLLIYPKVITAIFGVFLNYSGACFYGLKGVVAAGVAFPLVYLVWVGTLHIFDKGTAELKGK